MGLTMTIAAACLACASIESPADTPQYAPDHKVAYQFAQQGQQASALVDLVRSRIGNNGV